MTEPTNQPTTPRRKRLWTALAGTVSFLALGLLLMPGLARHEPAPAAQPGSPPAAEQGRLAGAPEAAGAWLNSVTGGMPEPEASDGPRAFDCMIGPGEVLEIGSAITGVIDEILVERSDYIEAGQVLVQLEASVERAAVDVARARAERTVDIESSLTNLELGERRLERAHELFEREVLSLDLHQEIEVQTDLARIELERAHEDRRLASLQLRQATAALERRTIRSPVSGVVVERLLAPGEVVDEETILRIATIDPLRVEALLPSDWFGRIRPGGTAQLVPEAPLDQARVAEVAIVDPIIDGASGTFGVQLQLPNPDRDLPAGLRCQVRFAEDDTAPEVARAGLPAPASRAGLP